MNKQLRPTIGHDLRLRMLRSSAKHVIEWNWSRTTVFVGNGIHLLIDMRMGCRRIKDDRTNTKVNVNGTLPSLSVPISAASVWDTNSSVVERTDREQTRMIVIDYLCRITRFLMSRSCPILRQSDPNFCSRTCRGSFTCIVSEDSFDQSDVLTTTGKSINMTKKDIHVDRCNTQIWRWFYVSYHDQFTRTRQVSYEEIKRRVRLDTWRLQSHLLSVSIQGDLKTCSVHPRYSLLDDCRSFPGHEWDVFDPRSHMSHILVIGVRVSWRNYARVSSIMCTTSDERASVKLTLSKVVSSEQHPMLMNVDPVNFLPGFLEISAWSHRATDPRSRNEKSDGTGMNNNLLEPIVTHFREKKRVTWLIRGLE